MLVNKINHNIVNFNANIAGLEGSSNTRYPQISIPAMQDRFEKLNSDIKYKISAQDQIMGACGFKIPDITIELHKKINTKRLSEAINEALVIHPLFKTKLGKSNNGLFYWAVNNKKPVIRKDDSKKEIVFGTDEYNNFPWLIRYKDNKIFFTASHMLCDGMGALNFLKTILKFYFIKSGIKFNDNTSKYSLTAEDAYLKYGTGKVANTDIDKTTEPKKASEIALNILTNNENSIDTHRLTIDKYIIKQLAKGSNTSMSAVISYLLAKAMEKTIALDNGTINLPIPVNCRKHLPSNTDRNFIMIAPLNYDIKTLHSAALSDVAQVFRRQLDETIQPDNFFRNCIEIKQLTDKINTNPQILKDIKLNSEKRNKTKNATICYSHITQPEFPAEIMPFIKSATLDSAVPLNSSTVCAFGFNFNDKIALTIKHLFKNNTFIENLKKVLEEENIDYSIEKLKKKADIRFTEM